MQILFILLICNLADSLVDIIRTDQDNDVLSSPNKKPALSLINNLSATDAMQLLDDLSSNEGNASSMDYDTDEAEENFLKGDSLDTIRILTSPINAAVTLVQTPPLQKKVYLLENLKAKNWTIDDGEFGTHFKDSSITMIVAAGYSIEDFAATAVANGYTSDTDVSDDESVGAASFSVPFFSTPEKTNSSFDSKATLSPDHDCIEQDDLCLENLPMEVKLGGMAGIEIQQGEPALDMDEKETDTGSSIARNSSYEDIMKKIEAIVDAHTSPKNPEISALERAADAVIENAKLVAENSSAEITIKAAMHVGPSQHSVCANHSFNIKNKKDIVESTMAYGDEEAIDAELEAVKESKHLASADFLDGGPLQDSVANKQLSDEEIPPDDDQSQQQLVFGSARELSHIVSEDSLYFDADQNLFAVDQSTELDYATNLDAVGAISFVDEILMEAADEAAILQNTPDNDCNNDVTVCEDANFWEKHMVIDSTIYEQLISWKKSFKEIAEHEQTDGDHMRKLLAQLESLLLAVDEPPNELSRSECLTFPKRDEQRCYTKVDIQELRRAYKDQIRLLYDRETLMELGKSRLAMQQPSFDTEKVKSVLK